MEERHGDRGHTEAGGLVSVLGGFDWRRAGVTLPTTAAGQRLIAFLAVRHRPIARGTVAGTLWPEASEARASASLRTELWKLGKIGSPVHVLADGRLTLDPATTCDLHEATELAHRLIDGEASTPSGPVARLLHHDLLPDWAEDWLEVERARFHQLRLHALDALCDRHAREQRYAAAVDTALAAIDADPYRESSRRCLVAAYLGEGNVRDAIDEVRTFERLLAEELEAEPTNALRSMIPAVTERTTLTVR